MLNRRSCGFSIFALLIAFATAPVFGEAMTEEFQQVYPLAAGGAISLENINGDVKVEVWDRDEVEVHAIKTGPNQAALDRVQIEVDASSNRVRIESDHVRGDEGRSWGGKEWASVDYTLRVPRGARISEIELVNGSLDIHGLHGDVEASLVNGSVEASGLTGDVELSTVNGGLSASFAQLDSQQSIELSSVNGSVKVSLSRSSNAEIKASTVHGRIRSDFDFEVKKGQYVGRSMRGRLGNGGASIDLSNVNGSITVSDNG